MKAGETRLLACSSCHVEFNLMLQKEPCEQALSSPSICPFCHSGFITKKCEKERMKEVQLAAERGFDTLFEGAE